MTESRTYIADELADILDGRGEDRQLEAANMLRQQAKEIEALKLRELTDAEIQEIGKPFLGYVTFEELDFARAILKKASEKCTK